MPRLEDLLLVLLLQAHAIVDVLVAHLDLIDRLVFAHRVDVFFDDIRFFLLIRLVSSWVNHNWQFFDIVGSNVSDLQGWLLVSGDGLAPCLVLSELNWCQAGSVLEHFEFHVSQSKLLKSLHDGQFDLSHVKVALHFLVLVIFQAIQVGLKRLL